jgi:hypothetical protein
MQKSGTSRGMLRQSDRSMFHVLIKRFSYDHHGEQQQSEHYKLRMLKVCKEFTRKCLYDIQEFDAPL